MGISVGPGIVLNFPYALSLIRIATVYSRYCASLDWDGCIMDEEREHPGKLRILSEITQVAHGRMKTVLESVLLQSWTLEIMPKY